MRRDFGDSAILNALGSTAGATTLRTLVLRPPGCAKCERAGGTALVPICFNDDNCPRILIVLGSNSIAFENGASVPATDFVYPVDEGTDDPEARSAIAFGLLQTGLLIAIDRGHRDGLRTRLLALMRLCEIFPSDAAAARYGGMNRSGLSRAVRQMRRELEPSLTPDKIARIALKQRRLQH